jgi:hypothetical protein
MRHFTLKVADAVDGMLSVRLSRNGLAVVYSLTRQDGRPVLGPCGSEQQLEELARKWLAAEDDRVRLSALARECQWLYLSQAI